MTVPNLHAKLASLVELDPDATDSQILAAVRNLRAQRDTYRELADATPWQALPKTWAKIGVGEMIERDGKTWTVLERQLREARTVAVTLWRVGKTFPRVYGLDDVATVLEPRAMAEALHLARDVLGGVLMTPEEIARAA